MQSYHRTTHRDILEWCDKRVIMSDAMQGMMLVVRNWSRNDGNVWIIAILSLVLTTGDAGESGDTGWVGANISSMDLMLMISGGLVSLDHFFAGLSYDRWIGHSGSSLLCCKDTRGKKYKDIRVERMEGIIRWDALARINF